jgi:hypothetical protein
MSAHPCLQAALREYDAATKPRTITVNGIEVPEPVRNRPDEGDELWAADVTADDDGAPVRLFVWFDDGFDNRIFRRGLIHRTREAAEAHVRALLAASEVRNG